MTLVQIEHLTREYARRRQALVKRMEEMRAEVTAAYKKHLAGVHDTVESVGDAYKALYEALREAPELFQEPRTVYFSGVRVGYIKQRDHLEWPDDDQLAQAIQEQLPDLYPSLVKIERHPIEKSVILLDPETLKKLGVTVDVGKDDILIKVREDDVDKLVGAFVNKVEKELAVEG
jgi:phage host-nuclease inhibitor protein Gam